MVEQEAGLRCLKCGYALRGLPARKCGDCGHVYLRCPECGAPQIANEAQNRLLLQMRARAMRLPRWIQGAQITFLVVMGVWWWSIEFGGGAASPEMSLAGHLVVAGMAALSACLVRLLVFQLKSPWLASGSAMTFLMGTFAVGLLYAWASDYVDIVDLLVLGAYVAAGAAIGARGAEAIGWTILWLFAKDEDRVVLTAAYRGALSERLRGDGAKPARDLMYCTRCAAELPALVPATCEDCGLQQVTCPSCGKHCGVSDALRGMNRLGETMRVVSAGVWVAVRMLGAAYVWRMMVERIDLTVRLSDSGIVGMAGGWIWVPADWKNTEILMLYVALLTCFVFMRGAAVAASFAMSMVLLAWLVLPFDYGSALAETWGEVLVLAILAAVVSLLASSLGWLVRAMLPKRRVAMLEELVPELARDPAPSPAGTRTGT